MLVATVITLLSDPSTEHYLCTNVTIKNEKVRNKWKEQLVSRKIGENLFLCGNDELFRDFNANKVSVGRIQLKTLFCLHHPTMLVYVPVLHSHRKGKFKLVSPREVVFELNLKQEVSFVKPSVIAWYVNPR